MTLVKTMLQAGILATAMGLLQASPAAALTMQECSAKYKAAQTANTLNGMKWNDFRKAQCGTDAPATAAAPAAPAATSPLAKPAAAPAAAAAGSAVFPRAVSTTYAKESPGVARRKTCLDQYNANKAKSESANGGMLWIQKGGGYWSECNKRLKAV
jgi:hypothetical protein